MEREEDMGRVDEFGGDLDMAVAFEGKAVARAEGDVEQLRRTLPIRSGAESPQRPAPLGTRASSPFTES